MFDLVSSTSLRLRGCFWISMPLVVVVDRDRELLLGLLLADDVLVEELLDLVRRRQRRARAAVLEPVVVGDDVVADLDALVADEDGRARNQLADVVLILVAERAAKNFVSPFFLTMLLGLRSDLIRHRP